MPASDATRCELSIVMPCLNEAETLETCIRKALGFIREHEIDGEVIVADNGSTDGSQSIAQKMDARLVNVAQRGYGAALAGGIAEARGEIIIMGDSDDSYDFSDLRLFVERLRGGYDLVMGNRFNGDIKPGAMPKLHRYIGNPVLSGVGHLFFRSPCGDFHCGLRGFTRKAVERMDLRTTGMEFASEMVVKATLHDMRICEIPTTLWPDGRSQPPHLRRWRDGWRHLRFLLLYSPRWLFLYPGAVVMLAGLLVSLWLLSGPKTIGGVTLDIHTLLYAASAILIGFQSILFSVFTKVFAMSEGLIREDPRVEKLYRYISLELGLIVGGVLFAVGMAGSVYALKFWSVRFFGNLDASEAMRVVIPSATLFTLGCQVILSSFFLSVLGLGRK